jgi:hypothetical protein
MSEMSENDGAVSAALLWLRGALDCKEFAWDADQREAAEQAYSAATSSVAALEPLDTGNWADDPLYKALDALYERGWEDHPKKKYDPRGTKQWDAVLFMFRGFRDKPVEVVTRKMVRSMRKILKERWSFHIGAEAARDVLTAAMEEKRRA